MWKTTCLPNPVCKDMDKGWIKVWFVHKMEQTATTERKRTLYLYVLTWDKSQTRLRGKKKKCTEKKEGNKGLLSV